ncbi:MAG: hypothetical protein IJW26_03400 [Clostridia bacterium]|nr:hypothetical protein [Clostridia bacterium]
MSKHTIIARSIVAGVMTLLCVWGLVILIDGLHSILFVENGGLAAIGLIAYFVYGAPIALVALIYQVVRIVTKKFWIVDFIPSLLLIIIWASLYLAPAIISAIG